MNDHELDEQMRLLAQSYNEPPATPRDAMWSRIEHARERRSVLPFATSAGARWLRSAAGIAAVLAVGIGIGRLSRGGVNPSAPVTIASVPNPATGNRGGADGVGVDGTGSGAAATSPSGSLVSAASSSESTNPVRATREQRLAALRDGRRGADRGLAAYAASRAAQGGVNETSESSAYRVAVVEHMARTEVLLTSFLADSRTSPIDTRAAAQFAALSRDLLKTTRLLLATRSTEDPALTRLLEDLELVLMQISQYSSEGRRGDLDAINQSIDRRNVLPKLRSAIPAGASASTGI